MFPGKDSISTGAATPRKTQPALFSFLVPGRRQNPFSATPPVAGQTEKSRVKA